MRILPGTCTLCSSALRRLVCVLLLSAAGADARRGRRRRKPNIVFILADDLDYGTLQYFPNIWNQLSVSEAPVRAVLRDGLLVLPVALVDPALASTCTATEF